MSRLAGAVRAARSSVSSAAADAPMRLSAGGIARYCDLPQRLLVRIAADHFGRTDARNWQAGEGGLSLERLTDFGERHGFDIRPVARPSASISPDDCPIVLLMASGDGLLVRSAGGGIVEVDGPAGTGALDLSDLEDAYTGIALEVHQKQGMAKAVSGVMASVRAATRPDARQVEAPSAVPKDLRHIVSDVLTGKGRLMGQLCLAALLNHILLLSIPVFIMAVYDRIIPHLAMETLWAMVIGVGIALGLDLAIRMVRARITDAIALQASSDGQTRLFSRLLRMRYGKLPSSAGRLTQAFQDADTIYQMIPNAVVAIFIDLPFFVVITILLAVIAGPVAVVPVIGALALTVVNLQALKRSRRHSARLSATAAERVNMVAAPVDQPETIRAATLEGQLVARWNALVDEHAMAIHESRQSSAVTSTLSFFISNAMTVLTMLVGVYGISAGYLTVGALAASTMLVGRALAPVGMMVGLIVRLWALPGAVAALSAIEDTPLETGSDPRGAPVSRLSGGVAFSGASFSYPRSAASALGPLDITIAPGERVGIVGRVGCGKSTLLRLAVRLHDPSSGMVALDGYDARQFDPRVVRSQIAYLPQSPELFDASLFDNLVMGGEIPDETRLKMVCEATGLASIVAAHPDGFGMACGPRGSFLSGGERQTVALTRTLLRNAPVLLLDEPTSAMDTAAERNAVQRIKPLVEGRTLVVATHRPPILALVDRIIIMERGRVIADGARDEILSKIRATDPVMAQAG